MSLTSGTRLGPYEIQSALGAGGMGEVYKARDTRLERTVAIKVLPAHFSSNADLKQRFEREAKTISSLNHPNICTLHDVGHDSGTDYLVLEFIEGETLAQRLGKGALSVKELLRVGSEIADALDKAHRAGIVHRDLKPGNVMLTKTGAKLLDFGLAKPQGGLMAASATHGALTQTSPASPITQQGTLVGTFQYMSPEQVEGREADARSDIFALGAVLYEMATGKRAFDGKSQISVASAILEKEPEPISATQPMSPPALDHVIRTCLAKDPEERFQTAHDIKLQLKWISESGSQAGAPALHIPRRPRLGRPLWAAAGLAVVAVAMGAAYMGLHRKPAELIESSILPPPQTLFDSHTSSQGIGSFAISPNGQLVVFGAGGADGSALYIRSLKSSQARELPGSVDASYPFWSPDSKSVGFFAKGALYVLDVDGSSAVQVATATDGRGATWGADGYIYFTPATSGPILRVPHGGGTAETVTKIEAGIQDTQRWPVLLPDGKHLLYFAASHSNPNTQKTGIFWAAVDGSASHFVVRSIGNAAFAAGYLLSMRGQVLVAQRFDPATGTLSGDPITVTDGVELDTGTWHASFSVDEETGKLVYVGGIGANQSFVVSLDAAAKQTARIGAPDQPVSLRVSAATNKLLVVAGPPKADLWIVDLNRNVTSRFTFSNDHQSAVWSPDGKQIAYCERNEGVFQLFVKDAAGIGPARQLLQSDTNDCPGDWSPDGKTIAFIRNTASGAAIWLLPFDTPSKPYPMLENTPNDQFMEYPAFSPDGRWLAYTSNQSGNGIFVVSLPDRHGKWQVSSVGGSVPVWARDGRTIYYIADSGDLMAVPVSGTAAEFTPGAPRAIGKIAASFGVGSMQPLDVAAKGNGFVGIVRNDVSAPALTLVQNWQELLKK